MLSRGRYYDRSSSQASEERDRGGRKKEPYRSLEHRQTLVRREVQGGTTVVEDPWTGILRMRTVHIVRHRETDKEHQAVVRTYHSWIE
jgi:hypothetical protein